MFGRRKPNRLHENVEFVSAPALAAALAKEEAGRAMTRDMVLRVDEEGHPETVTQADGLGFPLLPFYASRTARPADPSWRYLAACVVMAPDAIAARDQLDAALRQRGSGARIEDFAIAAIPVDGGLPRDHGIVLTTMVEPT